MSKLLKVTNLAAWLFTLIVGAVLAATAALIIFLTPLVIVIKLLEIIV